MKDTRDLLQVLKAELSFLENGGYRNRPRHPWRPNFIFEDSPTCMNFSKQDQPPPCSECVLMKLVPKDRQETAFPCRHIPLTERGETVNSFYEWGTEEELEAALAAWLRQTIRAADAEPSANKQST